MLLKEHKYAPYIVYAINNIYCLNSIEVQYINKKYSDFKNQPLSRAFIKFIEHNKNAMNLKNIDNGLLLSKLLEFRHALFHLERNKSLNIIASIEEELSEMMGTDKPIYTLVSIFLYKDQFQQFNNILRDIYHNLNDDIDIIKIKDNLLDDVSLVQYKRAMELYNYFFNRNENIVHWNKENIINTTLEDVNNEFNKFMNTAFLMNKNSGIYIEIKIENKDKNIVKISNCLNLKNKLFTFVDINDIKNIKKIKWSLLNWNRNGELISFEEYNELIKMQNTSQYAMLSKEVIKYYKASMKFNMNVKQFLNELNINSLNLKTIRGRVLHFDFIDKDEIIFFSQIFYLLSHKEDKEYIKLDKYKKVVENVKNISLNNEKT